jgi:hypothetical protein
LALADLHRVERAGLVPVALHPASAAREEQALGVLPHQNKVDLGSAGIGQRHPEPGPGPDRAHTGVQVEREADVELRDDLGPVASAHVWQPHCAEQDRVGVPARHERIRRECITGVDIVLRAGRMDRGDQAPTQSRLERFHDLEGRVGDFDADAVAWKYGDLVAFQGGPHI